MLSSNYGKRLTHAITPGYSPGRLRAPGGGGLRGEVARSYISAAYWAARNSLVELLEPLNHLSCLVGAEWSLNADQGLIHAYGYLMKCPDEGRATLELRIHRDDVREKGLYLNH